MISSYEVRATLSVADRATPALERVLGLARSLAAEFQAIRVAAKGMFSGTGIDAFVARIGKLEPAVAKVAEQMAAFRTAGAESFGAVDAAVASTTAGVRALNEELAALKTQNREALAAAVGAGGGGSRAGGGRSGGGGGGHLGGSVPVPMGPVNAHARFGIGPAAVAGAGLTYGLVEDAELSDAITRILYTGTNGLSGTSPDQMKRQSDAIRKQILDVYSKTGMPLKEIEEAALGVTRLMAPAPLEQRTALFDQVISAAAMETRLKGGDLSGNTEAIVGLLHMSGFYRPDEIKRLIPAFTYGALFDPQTIQGMTRAAGYVIPTTARVANLDPVSAMQMVALLQSSGISNSKAGTWLESAVEGLLPGTRVFTGKAAEQQLAVQKRLGLVDSAGKSLIQGPGGTDVFKGFMMIMERLQALGDAEKSQLAHDLVSLGGKQGARALAMFTDPIVLKRSQELMAGEKSYEQNQPMFWSEYKNASTVQEARTAVSEFNRVLIDLGEQILPLATRRLAGLVDFIKVFRTSGEDQPAKDADRWIEGDYDKYLQNKHRLQAAYLGDKLKSVEAWFLRPFRSHDSAAAGALDVGTGPMDAPGALAPSGQGSSQVNGWSPQSTKQPVSASDILGLRQAIDKLGDSFKDMKIVADGRTLGKVVFGAASGPSSWPAASPSGQDLWLQTPKF